MKEARFSIVRIGLTIDYGIYGLNDIAAEIKHALTSNIDPVHLTDKIGYVCEAYDNGEYITRSSELYRIEEYENKIMCFSTESFPYFTMACNILKSINVDYSISYISFDINFDERLEDIASIYTKESPNIQLNESMFINRNKSADNISRTVINCDLCVKNLDSFLVEGENIFNSIVGYKATYCNGIGDLKTKVIRLNKNHIESMTLKGIDLEEIGGEVTEILFDLGV